MAPKRVLVHRAVATELEGRLARAFSAEAAVSAPARARPRIRSAADAPLRQLLTEAITAGAHFVTGGDSPDGTLQLPIILAGVEPPARLLRADVFAPVLSLVTVAGDAEAVARANDCPYALGASVFSRDESAARAMAGALNAGAVTINDLIVPTADARVPFGGRKRSGFGVTRGPEGLLELTVPKVVSVSRAKFRPALEPAHPQDEAMFHSYLELAHGRGFGRRARALVSLCRAIVGRNKPNRKQSS